jgi:hypothetical protein
LALERSAAGWAALRVSGDPGIYVECVVSGSRSSGCRFVEGEISGVVVTSQVVNFRLEKRRVTVEKTAATAALRNGQRIRALLQAPLGDAFFHVIAFQTADDGRIHYTGPTLTLYLTFLGAGLLATGLYAGLMVLPVCASSLFVLEWILSAQKVEALRSFSRALTTNS